VEGAFLAFLGVSILVIVTPGPDTALTVRNSLLGGHAGGIGTALGVSAGQLIWALAASAGLAAILAASEPLFHAVKLCGSRVPGLARCAVAARRATAAAAARRRARAGPRRAPATAGGLRTGRTVEAATGAVLIGLGAKLALDTRS
jgi:threonine/homoserine/homoserine lactone efflux protein